jgi:polyphosphate:AMP phosphotransferase
MLAQIDLTKKLEKHQYKETASALGIRLGEAQRGCRDHGIPVMIIFEGWSASGKGTRIGSLIRRLDPRGFEVFTIQSRTAEEKLYPYMWRFWRRTPAAGRIHIFDRSWYRGALRGYEKDEIPLSDPHQILSFERQLADTGVVILKLFLHVSRKEQKKRLSALTQNPDTAWRVTKSDLKQNHHYHHTLKHFDRVLEKTDHSYAKWIVIEADNAAFADMKICQIVTEALEEAIRASKAIKRLPVEHEIPIPPRIVDTRSSILGTLNQAIHIDLESYRTRLAHTQTRLSKLHNAMFIQRVPAAVLFEGWDAAGKGGAIKRTVSSLDPRGYEVVPSGAPNDLEKAHHYLWRYWNKIPKAGHLTVFDRTWYGRVLVERVEGFCTSQEWKRAFREINEFEEQLTQSGILLVKFWLHIDPEEQLRRFHERERIPEKQWKITDEDWRNREKWDLYSEAVDEMLLRTSTTYAPWTIVEANQKLYARVKVAETIADKLQTGLHG